ncbi:MAG: diguanylate cyclase [Paenisporosarcina sp.]|nr:diguanylate cyclase [Paenisporosarcina sp.]
MKIKVQTIFIIGISLILFLAFLMLVTRPIFIRDGVELDRLRMDQKLSRLETYMSNEAERLHRLALDWSVSDDTYQFINGYKPTYIDSKLLPNTFYNLEIAYIFFFDDNNQLVYGKGQQSISSDLKSSIQKFVNTPLQPKSSFIANTPLGLVFIDIEQTFPTSAMGESNGKLVMIRSINETLLTSLQEELSIQIEEVKIVESTSFPKNDVHYINNRRMNGKLYLPLSTEGEYVEFTLSQDRDYFIQKSQSLLELFFIFLIMILLLISLIYVLMDRLIVSRVSKLSKQLRTIQQSRDVSSRLSYSRNMTDEIYLLERTTNDLLDSLEKSNEEINRLAFHDYLTGLPNRFKFEYEFNRLVKSGHHLAVLFLDLDGFKSINDVYGHTTGDLLLTEVASRLTACLSLENALVSRYGGDEFTLMIQQKSFEELEDIGNQVTDIISEPYVIDGIIAHITTSIGISRMPEDSETFDQLIQHADQAMYESKRNGKNQIAFYMKQDESPSQ